MEMSVAKVALDNEDEYDDEYESGSTLPNLVLVLLLVLDNRIFEMDFRIVLSDVAIDHLGNHIFNSVRAFFLRHFLNQVFYFLIGCWIPF